MKFFYLFIFICLVNGLDDSISTGSESFELDYIPHIESSLDLRGTIRQLFAVEAGLGSNSNNVVCSPLSAMLPLAKMVLGAKKSSQTEKELLTSLGLSNTREVKAVFKRLITDIEYLNEIHVTIANRIYLSDEYRLKSSYINKVKKVFRFGVETVNANKPQLVADSINEWVSAHTNGKITRILNPGQIDSSLSLILVNAIYFQGTWVTRFNRQKPSPFYGARRTQMTDMMQKVSVYKYIDSDDLNAQIIELPFIGEQASMIILLPRDYKGLPILLRTLKVAPTLLNEALSAMKSVPVNITMPKFKFETTLDLREFYKRLDITTVLSKVRSQLSEMVRDKVLYVSNAIQKAVIEVDEVGTMAAASTAIVMIPVRAVIYPKIIQFNANHPFLFYIKIIHEELFAGVIHKP